MDFGFVELNNLTHNSDYYIPCTLNGLPVTLHKHRFTMYISGEAALKAFSGCAEFNAWRNKPVVINEGRELKLPQVSLEFNECDLSFKSLAGYNLSTSRFKSVYLKGANLTSTDLSGVHFENVDFNGADLSGARLNRYSQFINCIFENANVRNTALPGLLSGAVIGSFKRFKFENCRVLPGVEMSLPRDTGKQKMLIQKVRKLTSALKPVDNTWIFITAAQLLHCEDAFNIPDPHTKFLEELGKSYPSWDGIENIEKIVAEISAELVFKKLRA
ncbi:MAG: pentapeptide repeat-containing protein [Desulfotomaculum sp.]|nr:pentapeptide repeat-containing protein [Desulfotomaculum sp.]